MGLKYSVNESFFHFWSRPMAYVLGFCFADGSLEDSPNLRGKYVRFGSTDKAKIHIIKLLLGSSHILVETIKPSRKTYYLLRIGSAELFKSLVKLGVTPNKSLSMKFPFIPESLFWDFVRGYFDGDGCVYIEKQKVIRVIFSSGSKDFLVVLNAEISKRIGRSVNITQARRCYQLRYSTLPSLHILKEMYHNTPHQLLMFRKYAIYKEFIINRYGVVAKW